MDIEKKIILFIKRPQIIKTVYFLVCMILSFSFGVLTHKYYTDQNFSVSVELPEQPIPLALQYINRNAFNEFDELPAEEGSIVGSKNIPEKNFVASKSGEKYYPIDCGSVSRIKEENKIFFTTEQEAQAKGYERSTTCN